MNERPSFTASSNKFAYAQAFSSADASHKRHSSSLRGRLGASAVRRRSERRGAAKI